MIKENGSIIQRAGRTVFLTQEVSASYLRRAEQPEEQTEEIKAE